MRKIDGHLGQNREFRFSATNQLPSGTGKGVLLEVNMMKLHHDSMAERETME